MEIVYLDDGIRRADLSVDIVYYTEQFDHQEVSSIERAYSTIQRNRVQVAKQKRTRHVVTVSQSGI